jgi:hypothetical protein
VIAPPALRCDGAVVRTTVDIDPDVLQIARSIAQQRKQSLGKVISDGFRKSLQGPQTKEPVVRNGVRVIARGDSAVSVTMDMVNALRDEV